MGLAAENDPHIDFNMKKRNPIARRQGSSPTFSLINTSSQTGDTNLNVTELINKLRSFRQVHQRINVPESDIFTLCQQAREIFLSDPMLLEVEAPLRIVGDIHGQFSDLLKIMNHAGYPPAVSYLFLGDYVDRGKNSLETMVMLLALKVKYPNNMHMLRGNHESHIVNRSYGFYDECKRRYTVKLWKSFVDCYNCMPVAAIVSKRIFCCHGGISQSLNEMKDIKAIKRPTEVPEQGLMCDLLWSDPDHKNFGYSPSDRGVSFLFGRDVLEKFLRKFDFDLVCRGHQVVEDGYEFFAKRQMVTLFSAPNYCGQWDNAGASMGVDHNLMVTFAVLKPVEKKKGAK